MIRSALLASALALSLPAGAALAQTMPVQAITGTRLDIVATGEVNRVPDVARINAGVVTQARTATEAIAQNAQQMSRVIAALKRAGIAERDIQTSSINLNPDYRYQENQPPVLTGYQASNSVSVKFRDIRNAIAREKQLKGWLRAKKIELIERENKYWRDLAADWYPELNRPGDGSTRGD